MTAASRPRLSPYERAWAEANDCVTNFVRSSCLEALTIGQTALSEEEHQCVQGVYDGAGLRFCSKGALRKLTTLPSRQ